MSATNRKFVEQIGIANDNWLMTADGDPTAGDGLPSGVGSWLVTPSGVYQKTNTGDTDWSLGTLVAAAGTLTGTTLALNVVTSSLTTIGTLVAGAVPASLVTAGTFGAGDYVFPGKVTITTANALLWSADNNAASTIGAAGANRPSTGYFGTSVVVGTDPGGSEAVRIGGVMRSLTATLQPTGTTYPTAFLSLGILRFAGYDENAGASASQASIIGAAWNAWSATDRSAYLIFRTTATGATTLTDRWYVYPAGHLMGATDNTYDIGASGSTRPRTGYFGTSVVTPLLSATTRVTSPLLGTTSAVDVVLDRNSVTQLTLGSLVATFAGAGRFGAPVRLFGYTVATLPAAAVGDTAYVTDALLPAYGAAAAGGGAVTVPVFYNGAAWITA